MTTWIWQQPDWPRFTWQSSEVQPHLQTCWRNLGILLGRAGVFAGNTEESETAAALDALLQNILTSSAIEGERLNVASVRSSLARRLGIEEEKASSSPRKVTPSSTRAAA